MVHELKCWAEPYDATERGDKPFEFRKDDREPRFEAGDTLWLRRWEPTKPVCTPSHGVVHDKHPDHCYTGHECRRTVTYIIREGFGIPKGYCIMGLALPQQDVGEQPYKLTEGELIKGPNLPRFLGKPITTTAVVQLLNAAFAAGRSVPSPVGQDPTFTEAQVRAMLRDVIAATSYDEPHGTYRTNELVAEVADRHGLKQP